MAKNWKVFTIDWVPAEKSSKSPAKRLEKTLNRMGAKSIERMEVLEGEPEQLLVVIDSDADVVAALQKERADKKASKKVSEEDPKKKEPKKKKKVKKTSPKK